MTKTGPQALPKENGARETEETLKDAVSQLSQRMQSMEIKVNEQNASFNKNIADIFEAVRLFTSNSGNSSICDDHDRVHNPNRGLAPENNVQGAATRYSGLADLEFPKFNITEIHEWLFKVDQFFMLDQTPEEMKVLLASFHLDGRASTWHQAVFGLQCTQDWESYKALLLERFDESDDPIAELMKLQETDGIVEYQGKFERICARLSLPEEYLVSAYLSGLRTDMQMHIRMFQPQTIPRCFFLGRLYEKAHTEKDSFTGGQQSRSNNGGDIAKIPVNAAAGISDFNIGLQGDQSQESRNEDGTVQRTNQAAEEATWELYLDTQ